MDRWIIPLLVLGALATVNSLKCYVCDNCPDGSLTDDQLMSCGDDEVPSTTPPSVETNTTTSNNTNNATDNAEAENFAIARVRRHILPIDLTGGCNCDEDDCDCRDVDGLRVAGFADTPTDKYVCMKTTYKENSTDMVWRDCVPSQLEGKEFCAYLMQQNVTTCRVCETDGCNSAISLHNSIALLLMVTTVILFK